MIIDIFKKTFSTFFRQFGTFLALASIYALPEMALILDKSQMTSTVDGWATFIVKAISGLFLYPIACFLAIQISNSKELTLQEACFFLKGRMGSLIKVSFLYYFLMLLGAPLLLIPAIIMIFNGAVLYPVFALEGTQGFYNTYNRSKALMSGFWFELFVMAILRFIIGLLFIAPLLFLKKEFLWMEIPLVLILALSLMFSMILNTEFYFRIRSNKEVI